jgi:hypothetical protein
MSYEKTKYLKYKNKYLKLKKMLGGDNTAEILKKINKEALLSKKLDTDFTIMSKDTRSKLSISELWEKYKYVTQKLDYDKVPSTITLDFLHKEFFNENVKKEHFDEIFYNDINKLWEIYSKSVYPKRDFNNEATQITKEEFEYIYMNGILPNNSKNLKFITEMKNRVTKYKEKSSHNKIKRLKLTPEQEEVKKYRKNNQNNKGRDINLKGGYFNIDEPLMTGNYGGLPISNLTFFDRPTVIYGMSRPGYGDDSVNNSRLNIFRILANLAYNDNYRITKFICLDRTRPDVYDQEEELWRNHLHDLNTEFTGSWEPEIIPDFQSGTITTFNNLFTKIWDSIDNNTRTIIHCTAGYGRTGSIFLFILSYLNYLNYNYDSNVAQLIQHYIEFMEDENCSQLQINELFNINDEFHYNLLVNRINLMNIIITHNNGLNNVCLYKKWSHPTLINHNDISGDIFPYPLPIIGNNIQLSPAQVYNVDDYIVPADINNIDLL